MITKSGLNQRKAEKTSFGITISKKSINIESIKATGIKRIEISGRVSASSNSAMDHYIKDLRKDNN